MRKLFIGGAALTAVHIVAYAVMYALGPGTQEFQALSVLSGVFAGLGEVAVILLFAHLFSTYAQRLSAVLIPAGYLLNEISYCSTLYMSSDVLLVLRPVCKVLGIVLLLWCLVQKSRMPLADDEYPMQHGMSTKANVEPLSRFLSSSQDWVLILTGAMLLPLMFALIAQVNSNAGVNSGLYDVMNEFFAIALIMCLVWYGASRKARISFSDVLYLSLPLFATGCMLLPALWLAGNPLAGLLVKCGYTVNQVLFWVLLAHKSHDNLQHTYFYFGLFYGLYELFTAGGRLAMSWLYSTNGVTYEFVANLSLFCLWLLAMWPGVLCAYAPPRHGARGAGERGERKRARKSGQHVGCGGRGNGGIRRVVRPRGIDARRKYAGAAGPRARRIARSYPGARRLCRAARALLRPIRAKRPRTRNPRGNHSRLQHGKHRQAPVHFARNGENAPAPHLPKSRRWRQARAARAD